MRDLQHDAHTVPGLSFRIFSRAVLQVLYNMKRTLHGQVALLSILVHHRADPAVVMFKSRGIKPPHLLVFHHTNLLCLPVLSFLYPDRSV